GPRGGGPRARATTTSCGPSWGRSSPPCGPPRPCDSSRTETNALRRASVRVMHPPSLRAIMRANCGARGPAYEVHPRARGGPPTQPGGPLMAADSDRHLLFGLLALQNGLIQPAQLVAAFHAWTGDKARPLADHLVALGYLTPEQRPVLAALAA